MSVQATNMEYEAIKDKVDQELIVLFAIIHDIKNIDTIIDSVHDLSVQEEYGRTLLETIAKYKKICQALQDDIKEFIEAERLEGYPPNLNYRKLLTYLKA
jgi:hypothetical protein